MLVVIRVGRVLPPLAASVAVAVVAMSTNHLSDRATGAPVYLDARGQPAAASAAVQAHADKVFESFNGSVRQREAAGVLQAWALNHDMDSCMEGAGFSEWDWSATRNGAPRTNALATSKFFAKPLAAAHSTALLDVAETLIAEQELRMEELTEAEDEAVGVCLQQTAPTSDAEANAFSTPPVVEELRAAWWAMLDTLDLELGDEDAYDACIATGARAVGQPPVAGGAWQRQLAVAAPLAKHLPRSDAPGAAGRAPWARFTELESQWEQTDWDCRRDTYGARLGQVKAEIEKFKLDHAEEIEDAQRAWGEIVRRAGALGFRGQSGSLDVQGTSSIPAQRS